MKNGELLVHRFTVLAATSVALLLSIAPFMLLIYYYHFFGRLFHLHYFSLTTSVEPKQPEILILALIMRKSRSA